MTDQDKSVREEYMAIGKGVVFGILLGILIWAAIILGIYLWWK